MIDQNYEKVHSELGVISVIIPTKNEEKYISKCIESLESSDYPTEKLDLIVIDGGSADKTVDLVENLQRKYMNIRLIRYDGANTSVARNIGVKNSRGEIIFNFSSHALVEKGSLRILSTKLRNAAREVVGVGCKDRLPEDQSSLIAVCIDSITNTILGGKMMHQHATLKDERYFDSISFTAYRKDLFKEIGYFDPAFPAGDDAEFNLRIKEAGYKLLYTPETCVYRYRREKLKSFFWQTFKYGRSRMQINKAHDNSIRLAYVVPLVFAVYMSALVGLLFFSNILLLIGWGLGFFIYFLLLLAFSLKLSFHERKLSMLILCPLLYLTEHFAYGLGLLAGVVSVKRAMYNGDFGKE